MPNGAEWPVSFMNPRCTSAFSKRGFSRDERAKALALPGCQHFGVASEQKHGASVSLLAQQDMRTGVHAISPVPKDAVAAVTLWLCCGDLAQRIHFTPGHAPERDLMAWELLDQMLHDVAPSPHVMRMDAEWHYPTRDTKGGDPVDWDHSTPTGSTANRPAHPIEDILTQYSADGRTTDTSRRQHNAAERQLRGQAYCQL